MSVHTRQYRIGVKASNYSIKLQGERCSLVICVKELYAANDWTTLLLTLTPTLIKKPDLIYTVTTTWQI